MSLDSTTLERNTLLCVLDQRDPILIVPQSLVSVCSLKLVWELLTGSDQDYTIKIKPAAICGSEPGHVGNSAVRNQLTFTWYSASIYPKLLLLKVQYNLVQCVILCSMIELMCVFSCFLFVLLVLLFIIVWKYLKSWMSGDDFVMLKFE